MVETGGSGSASGSHAYAAAGFYTVNLTVTDKDGGSARKSCGYVVVYDPAASATGGGWIDSAAGYYRPNPSLSGRLNFGFTANYLRDATVPTGKAEIQFQAGNLNFNSTSYDWLVAIGQRAYLQGSGTVSNAGNYGFLLAVADEQTTGNTRTDKMRIKIWDKVDGAIVYDSQKEADIPAYPGLALAGGSVQIQK